MKAYCAFHDKALNYSKKQWVAQVEEHTEVCSCCKRPIDDNNSAFVLELDILGNLETPTMCNCFITGNGIWGSYYTKKQLEENSESDSIEEIEQREAEHRKEEYYEERKIEGTNEYGYFLKEEEE